MKNPDKQQKTKKKNLINAKWILTISAVSFILSVFLSYISKQALSCVGNIVAFIILLLFIMLGIIFDVIGVAATAATEKRFHSMASRKVRGAKQAIWIVRNAEKVGSFCNDVVGDISGIISGATSAIIIERLIKGGTDPISIIISLCITGFVSSLTIGGKAVGKSLGFAYSEDIVAVVGRIIAFLPGQKK